MRTPNPIAMTAALLLTMAGLLAFTYGSKFPDSNAGRKVFILPGIEVFPTTEDTRAVSSEASLDNSSFLGQAESAARVLGTSLTMPYYSFGSSGPGIRKE